MPRITKKQVNIPSLYPLGTCYTSEMGIAMRDIKTNKISDVKMNPNPEDYCLRGAKPHVFDQGRQCVCCISSDKESKVITHNEASSVDDLKQKKDGKNLFCGKPAAFLPKEFKMDLTRYKAVCENFCSDPRLSKEMQLSCACLCPDHDLCPSTYGYKN